MVRVSTSESGGRGSIPGRVIPKTKIGNLVAFPSDTGVRGVALGLVGPVSVYSLCCDWVGCILCSVIRIFLCGST